MTKLNIGVIGCGEVANGHIIAWKKVDEAKLLAVSDINLGMAQKTAMNWGIPKFFASLTELMKNVDVNVIDICTPPHTHRTLAVEAMEKGANVVLEKPMTMTTEDAESIVASKNRQRVKAGVIHNWLFEAPIIKATSLLRSGYLGDLLSVEIEAVNTKHDFMASNKNHWCHKSPGGRFGEMLAHPIYLIRHFLEGEVTISDIQVAKFGEYPWMKSDELTALFRIGKKMGRAYASFNAPRNAIYVSLYGTDAIVKLDIINATMLVLPRRGTATLDLGSDAMTQAFQIIGGTLKNTGKRVINRWLNGHDNYIRLFADSLLRSGEPPVSVEEGLKVVRHVEKVCDAIEKAERG